MILLKKKISQLCELKESQFVISEDGVQTLVSVQLLAIVSTRPHTAQK